MFWCNRPSIKNVCKFSQFLTLTPLCMWQFFTIPKNGQDSQLGRELQPLKVAFIQKVWFAFQISTYIYKRGATGAVRAPKPGKSSIMAARRRCCRRLLFFKIEVRPRPCRPYRVRRHCIYKKLLPWAWNLNLFITVIGGKFKSQAQDSDLEYFVFGYLEIWKTQCTFWKKATFSTCNAISVFYISY